MLSHTQSDLSPAKAQIYKPISSSVYTKLLDHSRFTILARSRELYSRIDWCSISKMPTIEKNRRGPKKDIHSWACLMAAALVGFICTGTIGMQENRPATRSNTDRRFENTSKARLLAAATAGGEYLVRMQRPDGSFIYSYDPVTDLSSNSNNIVRHAGTILSLVDLYAATGNRKFLKAAEKAAGFLETRFRRYGEDRSSKAIYVLDFDHKAKLGANGLALIALTRLAEFDLRPKRLRDANAIAEMILLMQRKDGGFESYYRLHEEDPAGDVSLYYPGEAMLGLIRLYRITGDARFMESAGRGAEYAIKSQRTLGSLPLDAWLVQALEALYSLNPKEEYAVHAIALAKAMMADQYTDGNDDFLGGFGPGIPRATPAASRCEGMLAAYRLAAAVNDGRANGIMEAIGLSLRFQLSQQFTPENAGSSKRPARALGGFRESPTEARIRIDFVQHNVCSLLGAARVPAGGLKGVD